MTSMMLFALKIVALIALVAHREVSSEASFINCGASAGWVSGGRTNFNTGQHASTFTAGGATCTVSVNPAVATFTAGQTFTVTVRSQGNMGFKVESTAGTLSGPSSGGSTSGVRCINWDKGRQSTATMTFTAPASGQAQIRAICSGTRGPVYAATPVALQALAPPTNAPVTSAPTTARPTVRGETLSPTVTDSPTPPTILTASPTSQSSDPNFDFDLSLGTTMIVSYKTNDTHAKFKVAQPFLGYVSIGPGVAMVGSVVIVGMDPAANAPNPGVGIYKILDEFGTRNDQILSNLAVSKAQLEQFGIVDAAFTSSTLEGSIMTFTLVLANQKPEFTLLKSDQSSVDLIYAVGPASSNGVFCNGGTCFFHDNGAFGSLTANFLLPPDALANDLGRPPVPLSQELIIHIITMVIGWGILIPLGIVIPLYNNIKYSPKGTALCGVSGPNWVKYHWVLQVIGLLFTYVGTLTGFNEVGEGDHWEDTHEQLGLFLLVASIIQPVYAFLRPKHGVTEGVKGLIRKGFDYGHPVFGYFIAFIAIFENIIGVNETADGTGGAPYSFNGLIGNTGLGGPMGMAILLISLAFFFLMGFGLMRAGYVRYFYKQSLQVEDVAGELRKPAKMVTFTEMEAHATQSSFWVIYKNKVYDITSFLNSHPGGKKVMLPLAGKDMTAAYNEAGHSAQATAMLNKYYLGELQREGRLRSISQRISQSFNQMKQYMNMPENFSSRRFTMAMSRFSSMPQGWGGMVPAMPQEDRSNKFLGSDNQIRKQVVLTDKIPISPNTYYLKFAFPGAPQNVLGLPTGKHIAIYAPTVPGKSRGKWNGKADAEGENGEISRKFTPITCDETDVGYFALVVKMYRPCKQFPDGGRISRYLEGLQVGQSITIAGPFGTHHYVGKGRMVDSGHELLFNECAMIAGGSGITPVLQIATNMLRDARDTTRISLVYANSSVDDILMKDYLDRLAAQYPSRFRVWYTVSKDPRQSTSHYSFADWPYSIGRINKNLMKEHLPPASSTSIAIHCGPPAMMQTVNKLLREFGYPEDRVVEY